ncbi:hypothetical protein Bhyg_02686 [Pseudolycoriella hygida]|uniref:Uncharacterized protein n=1 Tax=Pseudolycoriella hygida TaxID=35572 RepID=A0A9Q0NBW3_9DIPT|nr:hypothetical protein Bhyg_02686 [Pseudolycoriella hygida]
MSSRTRNVFLNSPQERIGIQGKRKLKVEQNRKEIDEVFDKVLKVCEEYLLVSHEDLFEFLDPIISDSQCQIHSLLIIGILLKLCDGNGVPQYKNITQLPIFDRKLLSYAVLFSTIKYEEKDNVGFVIINHLLDSIGIFSGKVTAEKGVLNNLKQSFNSSSIEYFKKISSGNMRKIFDVCDANLSSKRDKMKLQLLPCYGTFYSFFKYMEKMDLPIVVSLIRFDAGSSETDGKLKINGKSLLFYKFRKSRNKVFFESKKDLSEAERAQLTIVFTCFSVINENIPEQFKDYMDGTQLPSDKFLTDDCDIRELLMLSPAGHTQLTAIHGMNDKLHTEDYIRYLYKQHSDSSVIPGPQNFKGNFDLIEKNVFGCYQFHYKIAERFGMVNSRYAFRCSILNQHLSGTEKIVQVNRRKENTFFSIDHVNVSTYSREYDLLNTFMVGTEAPLVELKVLSKTNDRIFLQSRLAKIYPSQE